MSSLVMVGATASLACVGRCRGERPHTARCCLKTHLRAKWSWCFSACSRKLVVDIQATTQCSAPDSSSDTFQTSNQKADQGRYVSSGQDKGTQWRESIRDIWHALTDVPTAADPMSISSMLNSKAFIHDYSKHLSRHAIAIRLQGAFSNHSRLSVSDDCL